MQLPASFIDDLTLAADRAQAAEDSYRREAARQTTRLATERAFAFRRLNLMRAIANGVGDAASKEVAVSVATAALRARLGWSHDGEARDAVLARFASVAQAVFADLSPRNDTEPAGLGVHKALADFENWYAQTHPSAFWVLFENEMRETPVIDY